MKFLFRIILIFGLSLLVQQWLPWWSVAIVAFVVGWLMSEKKKRRLFGKKPPSPRSFLAGFIAIFLLWMLVALIKDLPNDSILSTKIYAILTASENPGSLAGFMMVLLTAFLGGLLGGLSALSGNLMGEAMKNS